LDCICCGLGDGALIPIGHLAIDAQAMLFAHLDCVSPIGCHDPGRRSRP
jgi:hypothetical protein